MTKKDYEKILNDQYADTFSLSQAIDAFQYLGSSKTIENNYLNHTLGSLLRRKDSIRFNVCYNQFSRARG